MRMMIGIRRNHRENIVLVTFKLKRGNFKRTLVPIIKQKVHKLSEKIKSSTSNKTNKNLNTIYYQ